MTERRQWGAAILGDPANLDHWISALAPPFDPWIEVRGEEIILRSASLEISQPRARFAIGVLPASSALMERWL